MATVADVLAFMRVLNNELRLGAGEADEARALDALRITQHQFELACALLPRVLQTTINVGTVANTETTPWPTTLLRLDAIWFLDDTTGRPTLKLKRVSEIGAHVPSLPWPLTLSINGPNTGSIAGYYANTSNFYWMPFPDGVHTARIYGLIEQTEFANRAATFTYPLRAKHAFAAYAAKLLRLGLDDDTEVLDALSNECFSPLLKGLRKFDRSEPEPRYYSDVHTT